MSSHGRNGPSPLRCRFIDRRVNRDSSKPVMGADQNTDWNGTIASALDWWRAAGVDARLMRRLADHRALSAAELAKASPEALDLLREWCAAGWLKEAA